ncbi:MAG TPA: MFS transporter [Ktedonobacterales bacterium]
MDTTDRNRTGEQAHERDTSGAQLYPTEHSTLTQSLGDALPKPAAAPALLSSSVPTSSSTYDAYAALRFREFRLLAAGRFLAALGEQMLGVAVGWELYERTHSALALGLVGLVQVLPIFMLALPAGHIADRFERKRIVLGTAVLLALGAIGLALLSYSHGSLPLFYGSLLLIGMANAFAGPASSTLLPQTVPPAIFTNAATWSSSSWQVAAVIGPALSGGLIALNHSATPVYLLVALANIIVVVMTTVMRSRQQSHADEAPTVQSMLAGVGFIRRSKVILAAITLDLFAVLFGGAVTLLPIFADDYLHVGAAGLGLLRAAPSLGAVGMALTLAHLPPLRHAGKTLLWAVAGFGIATIVFGISRSFLLSLAMLAVLGALDNVSVVIRSTLLLIHVPDDLRGRISAVNNVFVGASNELGGFESGLTAALIGPVLSVIGGGVGTILVVIVVALIWPEMRRLRQITSIDIH